MNNTWLYKASLGYLLLPFFIFCLTFIKLWIGIPVVAILTWISWRVWKQFNKTSTPLNIRKTDLIIGLIVLGCWVVLSGIGGFAFQNPDHHIRNAIFKDLIHYEWPVIYPPVDSPQNGSSYGLIYYLGYWLPAALIGKFVGWQAANVVLFLWTLLGVFITTTLIKLRINVSLFLSSLLLIFFSGMDILGTIVIRSVSPDTYPTLWPPITAIEWWVAGSFQFSSFTTQLFWVFNQAIPAWICVGLILNTSDRRFVYFIWALCFFFAPIPSLGLLPLTLLVVPFAAFHPENLSITWRLYKLPKFFKSLLIFK